MHYRANEFAVDPSRPTIIAKPPSQGFQTQMGGSRLSERDLGGIVAVYGEAPETPTDLTATTGASAAALLWRQPPTGGRPSHYVVTVGTSPESSDLGTFNVGTATSAAGVVAPGTYFAQVTAVNERGASAATEGVSFTVTTTLPPPGAPRDFAVAASGSTLTLQWRPPLAGGTVDAYIVQAGSASGQSDLYEGSVGTATGLTAAAPRRTYFIRVVAQNPAGRSAPSNEVRVEVTDACAVPGAPVLTVSRAGSLVTAGWSTPAGGPLLHYVLQAGRVSGGSDLFNASVGLARSASGVLSAGSYFVRVAAVAACGVGAVSNEVGVQVP
jgi:hypothetical protein